MPRILIVDDDKDILKFADAILSQAKYEVRTATDPIKAIELLSTGHWDLLITDANMPQYTGFELIKTIKTKPKHKNLQIAMLTGVREKKNLEKAIKAGVNDYIVKPIEPTVFLKKVEDLLRRNQPVKKLEIELSSVSDGQNAKISLPSTVTMFSEVDLTIQCNFIIPVGTLVNLETKLFEKIKIDSPAMRVLEVKKVAEEFEIVLGFVGLSQSNTEKIRSWLYTENAKRKQLAS